jgi:formylglycine-generating enzyme required for sulfatase activity
MSLEGTSKTASDRVSRLIELLAEERKTATSIEIAETLWLAMQMEPVTVVESEPPQLTSPAPPAIALEKGAEPELPPPPLPAPIPKANIAAPTPQAGVLPPQMLPVWLADPAMLTDSLAIVRALKPLLQKVDAGVGKRLDEAATVDNIARTQLCLPILEPEQEPWFDIVLVVDCGSSMHIWQRLVKDVVRILRRYGAFRDVQVFDLDVKKAGQSAGDVVQLISSPQRPGHRPKELIDQRGRRIAIVLSDCAGTYWWDGTLLPMLQAWGNVMPVVVWQMLPPWMWKRTALGRGTAVAIANDLPGAANQRLKTQIQERDEPEDAKRRLAMPVVTSEVRDLARWSLMVSGDRREITPGFLLPQRGSSVPRSRGMEEIARERSERNRNAGSDPDAEFNQVLDRIARDRVDRFLELASPQAQRLIMLLAAAPVITLPVVRLIRDEMLYEARSPLPVAEVFLSGLLVRLPGQEDRELNRVLQAENDSQEPEQQDEDELEPVQLDRQDLVQYDFAPRVRHVLLEVLPEVDTIEVINSVSAAVERRWNRVSDQSFRAFLTNPAVEVPEELQGLRSFASVTADILEQLGGNYADFAQQLRYGAGGTPPPKPGTDDGPFPDLEPFQFIDVQLVEELDSFTFTVATLHPRVVQPQRPTKTSKATQRPADPRKPTEWMIQRQQQRAYHFFESLAEDISLEMVAIPGGTFVMGSPADEAERFADEDPQHEVTVAPFFMGRYPITQAQWRTVAAMDQVQRSLDLDPSRFTGENHPVEQVSWHDAVEFCERLAARTSKLYRLPTEAEWEYACRAGTTTPFHFGDMITTEVANYDGNSTYNSGPKGESRGQTTPIHLFEIANAFGLSDMHGNVWEWCQDHWHGDYEGVPTDGSAWLTDHEQAERVIRGGSWHNSPRYCRSASRPDLSPDDRFDDIGFRVVCVAPRTL